MNKIVESGASTPATGLYRIADLTLDVGRRRIMRDGQPIELGKLTYSLLVELVAHAPNVVTHDDLVERIWEGRTTSPETVTQRVKMLRDALGDDADQPRYVALVRGHGYRLIPAVEVMGASEGVSAQASDRSSSWGAPRRRTAFLGVGALFVLATATGLSFVRDATPTHSAELPKLAVLPCDNESTDPSDADFAAGLHFELLSRLGELSGLRLIQRTSMKAYTDATARPAIAEIADRLDADYVLECSLQRAGDEILVAFEFVEPATGVVLFPERYRVDLDDLGTLFTVQSRLAARIADSLETGYTPAEQARIERVPTNSREAYALYLKSIDLFNQPAIALLNEAIRLDRDFALAHAALALRYALSLSNWASGPAETGERRAALAPLVHEHAERAIALDVDVVDAYTALGITDLVSWRWTEAETFLARGVELAPTTCDCSWQMMVLLLAGAGRYDEAVAVASRAREIDPGNPEAGFYGIALGYSGRYEAAAMQLEQMIEQSPTNLIYRTWLAYLRIALGDTEAAIEQLQIAERLAVGDQPVSFLGQWAYANSRAGRRDEAMRYAEAIEQAASAGRPSGTGTWAMAYLAIGDEARALEWLEVAAARAARHEPDESINTLLVLKANVTNDPVLRQPEFVDVLARIKGD